MHVHGAVAGLQLAHAGAKEAPRALGKVVVLFLQLITNIRFRDRI
jgi:hypothetical protein